MSTTIRDALAHAIVKNDGVAFRQYFQNYLREDQVSQSVDPLWDRGDSRLRSRP
jgi:hypothetical protein